MTTRHSLTGLFLLLTLIYMAAFFVMGHPYRSAWQVYGGGLFGWAVARLREPLS